MATLNIKNVPDRLYRKIQGRANKKHRSVAQEVVHISPRLLRRASLFLFLISKDSEKSFGIKQALPAMCVRNGDLK